MKKRKSQKAGKTPMQKAQAMTDLSSDTTDPQGSWTGCPEDPYEIPVQDADDL